MLLHTLLQTYLRVRVPLEICVGIIAVTLVFRFPNIGAKWFSIVESGFSWLARRRRLAMLGVGALSLAAQTAVLPFRHIPRPSVIDENSHLLVADTFAHGRITNPTHPMRLHLETFFENQVPAYQSMYPPGQGLLLATGQVLTGNPFWAVWFSSGVMCALICWMLQGWFTPEWALLGGMLAVLRIGAFTYWETSYFGGCLAAIGGALLCGALPRLKRSPRARYALLMGAGLAILANTRPYEGLVVSLPVAVMLFSWILGRTGPPSRVAIRAIVLPILWIMVPVAGAMGYYFWRTTGSPFRMPEVVWQETNQPAPLFVFQPLTPMPAQRYQGFRDLTDDELTHWYYPCRERPLHMIYTKLNLTYEFFLGNLLGIPLLLALLMPPFRFRWREISEDTRFMVVVSAAALAGSFIEVFFESHYIAPLTAVLYGLVVCGMRKLWTWQRKDQPVGRIVVRLYVIACILSFLMAPLTGAGTPQKSFGFPDWWPAQRFRMIAELQKIPGRHLVIVHYTADHDFRYEYVFNKADIDQAGIVWAHDLGTAENEDLIHYFKDRDVWLLNANDSAPTLSPYLELDSGNSAQPSRKTSPGNARSAP